MDSTPTSVTPDAPVVFRGKKRKFFRQRPTEEEAAVPADSTTETPEKPNDTTTKEEEAEEHDQGLSVAEIIRRRNARKNRMKGVGFGADDAQAGGAPADEDQLSLMIREEEQRALEISNGGVSKRFAAQTGLASDLVDKHMMEYIESEIAKRKSAAASSSHVSLPTPSSEVPPTKAVEVPKPRGNPTLLQAKLQEVDLGEEVRSRNETLTERARRKLQGEVVADEGARPKKVRLGRDGKPWRPRNRRNSDDVKRDQLVEEILRENRLDVYETPTPPQAGTPGLDEDGAADERIAEEFKREFMEAMAERHKKKKLPAVGAKKDEGEVLKGPKLGGSRNARAAMRDLLLKKEKEAKK